MADTHLTAVARSILPAACSELADLASDSVIVCDLDGLIRYWNPASETLYGWPTMAAIGRGIAEFSPSPALDAEHWRQLLREGHWEGPVRRRTANGSHITAVVRRVVRHNDAALPVEVVEYGRRGAIGVAGADAGVTVEDITERLRAEAQLRQHQADHGHASRISTLGELATSIAHEVKQPLAAIVTNAETCLRWLSREPTNTEKLKQLTSRIISSARRASDIVQHVRSMAQSGDRERLPLDAKELVEEALLFVHHDIESKHIKLTISADPSRLAVLGDRIQLQQVVVNLVVNSIQAVSQTDSVERRIRIGIDGDAAGGVCFSIRDSGPGIAAQDLDRVFDSFFTTKAEGMGIGLAVCHSIITAHGGSIQAANHPDGGACFRFSLPAAPQHCSAID